MNARREPPLNGIHGARLATPQMRFWVATFGPYYSRTSSKLDGEPGLRRLRNMDALSRQVGQAPRHARGRIRNTFVAFFLAEMGDKTQFATIALATRFDALTDVVLGTTVGILLADAPAVLMGQALAQRIPMQAMRRSAATLFMSMGLPLLWPAVSIHFR